MKIDECVGIERGEYVMLSLLNLSKSCSKEARLLTA